MGCLDGRSRLWVGCSNLCTPHVYLSPVLQVYRDADLLLGAYNVPLEYDEGLIRQVLLLVVVIGFALHWYCCWNAFYSNAPSSSA